MRNIFCLLSIIAMALGCQPIRDSAIQSEFGDFSNKEKKDHYFEINKIKNPNGHDIKSLAKLSKTNEDKLFEIIEKEGINIRCIPEGESIGKPGMFDSSKIVKDNFTSKALATLFGVLGNRLSGLTADVAWSGKVFTRNKDDCSEGTGENKVFLSKLFTLKTFVLSGNKYINVDSNQSNPDENEKKFLTALGNNVKSVSLVELNYAESEKNPGNVLDKFQIKDIMVPIIGKNGIVWIGRAYAGKWVSKTKFESSGLLAWFFLDFNKKNSDGIGHDDENL